MTARWTPAELAEYVARQYGDDPAFTLAALERIERWLGRGDGAAIYENHDLSHPGLGTPQIASYGSPEAQLETSDPPPILPDTRTPRGGSPNVGVIS